MGTEDVLVQTQCLIEEGQTEEGEEMGRKKKETRGERRTEASSLFTSHGQQALRTCEHTLSICIYTNCIATHSRYKQQLQTAEALVI